MIFGSLFCMGIFWSLVQSSVSERAVLEIVMHKVTKNGEYKTEIEKIFGHFSSVGSTASAEGDILQIHPMSICSRDVAEQMVYGWVGVMKLEQIKAHCMTLYEQAKVAIRRGATAVVFDVSDVPQATNLLKQYASRRLDRPVIIISDHDALRLMRIIQTQQNAWARIRKIHVRNQQNEETSGEFLEVGIFVAVFVILCIFGVMLVIFKCRHRDQQLSMSELAKQAIAKLETRKYQSKKEKSLSRITSPVNDVYSQSSNVESCAICLEDYQEGQVLRVLPCSHEFHRMCVDPWLVNKRTCPFCLYNIVEPKETLSSQSGVPAEQRSVNQTQFYQLPPNDHVYHQFQHSQYLHYLNYHSEFHNACTSCEGTVGSDSSCNSHCRQFHQNAHPNHTHQNFYPALPSCCSKNRTGAGHVFPCSTFLSSGISYSHHVTSTSVHHHHTNYCPTHRQVHNSSSHHFYLGQSTRLFQYKAKGLRTYESEHDYNSGKDTSIKAQFGSSSSESCSEPSHASLQCPECVQPCDNIADSNHSTFGSSDNQTCSDNSSYDSNVFWGGAPDQMCTDISSDKTSVSGISDMEISSQYSVRQSKANVLTDYRKNSASTLNLSQISGCPSLESRDRSSESSDSCDSVECSLNLSEISGLSKSCSFSSCSSCASQRASCLPCHHDNNHVISNSQCNSVPRMQFKNWKSEELKKNVEHSCDICLKYWMQIKKQQTTKHSSKTMPHLKQNLSQTLDNKSRAKYMKPTNHDTEESDRLINTQGACNVCLLSNNRMNDKCDRGLVHSHRLSRSCDILPSDRRAPGYHSDQVIYRQPQLITKDSIVTATSQGSSFTVHLMDKTQHNSGHIV